ncbi:MAG: 4'-phosphopantetheinyl transferase superfamily protein [Rikenellaceae bacterium]
MSRYRYCRALPSGGVLGVVEVCGVDDLPAVSDSVSVRRQCEIYSWHSLARELLEDGEAQFSYNEVGAPQIVGSPLYIGVSHSSRFVAVIISPQRAAIDIESLDRNFERVASRYLSAEEAQLGQDENFLAKVWSIKECAYKFAGRKGLRLLEDISVTGLNDERFTVTLAGGESFSGEVVEALDHVIAFVG